MKFCVYPHAPATAAAGSEPDWVGGQGSVYMAFSVRAEDGRAIYVGFSNAGGVESTTIPTPPSGTAWHRVVDTGDRTPLYAEFWFTQRGTPDMAVIITAIRILAGQQPDLSLFMLP